MPNSPRLSTSSVNCRLEWRPSRQERAALLLLALLGAFSLLNCDLPTSLAWPAAGIAVVLGGWSLRQSGKRPPREFLIAPDLNACRLNGTPLSHLDLRWRGPLLFVRWKHLTQRRWQHAVFWPDTLPAAKRRELKLTMPITSRSRGQDQGLFPPALRAHRCRQQQPPALTADAHTASFN